MIKKLPEKTFLKSFELVPRVAVNLLIVDSGNRLLLTKRTMPPGVGTWHYPGSFLLKNETILDCIERVASDELGLRISVKKAMLAGVAEDIHDDPRGHVIDLLYRYEAGGGELETFRETGYMKFFSALPDNVGFNHRETLKSLGFA